mmetsp:Transcript_51177/g.115029  ORF Transcript_51177/g.115029 Transcript_51177/m.115029 type:complete len:232 (+) Transcript_51177:3435-4130(+)
MSSPAAAASISARRASRPSRMARARVRAFSPRAAACSLPATFAIAWIRRVLSFSRVPADRKTRSLPNLQAVGGISSIGRIALQRSFHDPLSPALRSFTMSLNVLTNSSKPIRSGKPVRATRSASSTPDVCSCRVTVAASQLSAVFASFGLKQRMKWRSDLSRIVLSSLSWVRKVEMMPWNLLLLNFAPGAGADSCDSVKICRRVALSENCIRTTRSPLSGSLFLSSHNLVL